MHPTLERLETELALVLDGLDHVQTQQTPMSQAGKWRIQQIVEHLLLSYKSTIDVLQTRIDKASPTKAKPMLQQRIGQFFLIRCGRFPAGRLAPAPVSPAPAAPAQSGEELVASVHTALATMDQAASAAEHLFGSKRCASHMVLGPLSIPQWRKFHLVHGEHHIHQIHAILREHEF